eukprot:2976544-Amphidinium_carterae.1
MLVCLMCTAALPALFYGQFLEPRACLTSSASYVILQGWEVGRQCKLVTIVSLVRGTHQNNGMTLGGARLGAYAGAA